MANYYGRPAFQWVDNGLHVYQLPLCNISVKIEEIETKIQNLSLDKKYCEVDDLGTVWQVTVEGSLMDESDKATWLAFERWANKGNLFDFAPHYAVANRPTFFPSYWEDCQTIPDSKVLLNRTDGIAGRWDFSVSFFSSTYTN